MKTALFTLVLILGSSGTALASTSTANCQNAKRGILDPIPEQKKIQMVTNAVNGKSQAPQKRQRRIKNIEGRTGNG